MRGGRFGTVWWAVAGTDGQSGGTGGASSGAGGRASGGSNSATGETEGAAAGRSGSVTSEGTGTATDAGGALDSGSGGADAGDAATGAPPVVLPDGVIANVAYTCASPFAGVWLPSYFHLEDMEDGVFDTPGVTATANQLSSTFGPAYIDSVDCDDGVVDGTCLGCEGIWTSGGLTLTFDAAVLGALPTHVGLVWTDGGVAGGFGTTVTLEASDGDDQLIDSEVVPNIGDSVNTGATAEDRFFGIVHMAGVRRITVQNSSGGLEIDHLQYGR